MFFFFEGGGWRASTALKITYRLDAVRNLAPLEEAMEEEPLSKPSKKSSNAVAV